MADPKRVYNDMDEIVNIVARNGDDIESDLELAGESDLSTDWEYESDDLNGDDDTSLEVSDRVDAHVTYCESPTQPIVNYKDSDTPCDLSADKCDVSESSEESEVMSSSNNDDLLPPQPLSSQSSSSSDEENLATIRCKIFGRRKGGIHGSSRRGQGRSIGQGFQLRFEW